MAVIAESPLLTYFRKAFIDPASTIAMQFHWKVSFLAFFSSAVSPVGRFGTE